MAVTQSCSSTVELLGNFSRNLLRNILMLFVIVMAPVASNLTVIPEEYHDWSPLGKIMIGLDGTPFPAKSSPPVSKRTRGAAAKKK